jgi:hypothetical protein
MFEAALQKVVYDRLSNFPGMPQVYDEDSVPQPSSAEDAAAFPYVTVGDTTAVPMNTDDSTGAECTLAVHVWSRYHGYKEVRAIQALVYEALNRKVEELRAGFAALSLHLLEIEWEFTEKSFIDADGVTRHGVQRFRVLLDATT